ncbi:hypothetical protein CIHG_04404 [Coccidioides immitis H538.4]|uniref:Uncharacterized protein n=3 Tax=Coccidioides immitis TaxID=5501 RepID=A0A0J8R5L5_COCIT|nr:hypothetical protein CIRG_09337 [Coccidioides immitis RMSCC 2394]KMU80091.1 hypothetical protein CISG_08433 [Coccidioides immitis RMSCC 3703]KMU86616.1 hypothetical protein CIHG_04404 [Coccidioides immitis H538.4]
MARLGLCLGEACGQGKLVAGAHFGKSFIASAAVLPFIISLQRKLLPYPSISPSQPLLTWIEGSARSVWTRNGMPSPRRSAIHLDEPHQPIAICKKRASGSYYTRNSRGNTRPHSAPLTVHPLRHGTLKMTYPEWCRVPPSFRSCLSGITGAVNGAPSQQAGSMPACGVARFCELWDPGARSGREGGRSPLVSRRSVSLSLGGPGPFQGANEDADTGSYLRRCRSCLLEACRPHIEIMRYHNTAAPRLLRLCHPNHVPPQPAEDGTYRP